MDFTLRKATLADQPAIERLIAASVRGLSREDYTARQIELSIQTVFGVDSELIRDETYFVAVAGTEIVGCGGWSRRRTLYGASRYAESRDSALLDPQQDAAKIRAFFIHPDWGRRGIGTAILAACEREARAAGFTRAEMMATLPGVKLYARRGYRHGPRVGVAIGDGEEIECVQMSKELV